MDATKHKRVRPNRNRKNKYKYKDPNRTREGPRVAICLLCKKFLKKDRFIIGLCMECEANVRDPMYVKWARDYFNDPAHYQKVLTAIELLDSVYTGLKEQSYVKSQLKEGE